MLHLPFIEDAVRLFKQKFVGDGVDRLINFATAMLCIISSCIIIGKQLIGSPMTCWIPTNFKEQMAKYALDFCYIQNTYVVPRSEIDVSFNRGKYTRVNYYQWLSLYFVIQALIFYFPSYIWRRWYKNYDIDVAGVIKKSKEFRTLEPQQMGPALRKTTLSMMATIQEAREEGTTSPGGTTGRWTFYSSRPSFLTVRYLFVKVLNLVIVTVALAQVSDYLDRNDFFWSVHGIKALLTGTPWVDSINFPRVTMCDLDIRELGNNRNATIQCLLGMNYVNEKLFFVQWIWLTIVVVAAYLNIMHFAYNIFTMGCRTFKLTSWLNRPNKANIMKEDISLFAEAIGLDGFLTLYFVECHNGRRAAADLALYMFIQTDREMERLKCEKQRSDTAMARKRTAASRKSGESPIFDSLTPSSPSKSFPSIQYGMQAAPLPDKIPLV